MRSIALLLLSSCAGYTLPPHLTGELRRVDLDHPVWRPMIYGSWIQHTEYKLSEEAFVIRVGGELLRVRLQERERDRWPRDVFEFDRITIISTGRWALRCETEQHVESNRGLGYGFETTAVATRCRSEGDRPDIELVLDGWPRVAGPLVMNGRDYRVSASSEYEKRPAALIVARGSVVVLVVAEANRVWMRGELEDEERRALTNLAAALWASVELRAQQAVVHEY